MKLKPNIWDSIFHISRKYRCIIEDVFDGPTVQAGKRPRDEGIATFLELDTFRMF